MEPGRDFHQQKFWTKEEIRVYQIFHVLYTKLIRYSRVQSHLFQDEKEVKFDFNFQVNYVSG